MNKLIKDYYTLDNIEEAKGLILEDKYITLDVIAAFYAIRDVVMDEESLISFIKEAKKSVLNMKFKPLMFRDTREYCEKEFIRLKKSKTQGGNKNSFSLEDLKTMFDKCEIYAHRYIYRLGNPRVQIFIYNTPTEYDFRIAKDVISTIIRVFQTGLNSEAEFDETHIMENVQLRIRGMAKFIDIRIGGLPETVKVGLNLR